MRTRLPRAGAAVAAVALAGSTLLASTGSAHAADTAVITVTVVDQFGQPAAVALSAYDTSGSPHNDGSPSAPPITSTHTFTALPAGGYGFQSIGPWSGVECAGISPCLNGMPTVTPVVSVAEGGTGSYTMHVTMPVVTGGPTVGSQLTIQTSTGYSLLQGAATSLNHLSSAHTQQWLRGATDIPSATGPSYVTVPADGGQQVAARLNPSPSVAAIFADAGYAVPAYTTQPVAMSKNATKTKISIVRGAIRVKVTSGPGAVPDGKVQLKIGNFKAKAKLKKGKLTAALPSRLQPGVYVLKVKYLGSASFAKSKDKITLRVR